VRSLSQIECPLQEVVADVGPKTWLVLYQTLSKSFDSIFSTSECAVTKSLGR